MFLPTNIIEFKMEGGTQPKGIWRLANPSRDRQSGKLSIRQGMNMAKLMVTKLGDGLHSSEVIVACVFHAIAGTDSTGRRA